MININDLKSIMIIKLIRIIYTTYNLLRYQKFESKRKSTINSFIFAKKNLQIIYSL